MYRTVLVKYLDRIQPLLSFICKMIKLCRYVFFLAIRYARLKILSCNKEFHTFMLNNSNFAELY